MEPTKVETAGRAAAAARNISEEVETDDDSVVSQRFWAHAARAEEWRRSLSDADRRSLLAREAEVDAAFAGVE